MVRVFPALQEHPRRPDQRSGAASVEMAFVAPVLLMFIFGSIDFGRAMMVSNMLTTVAREGVRKGVTPNTTNSEITTVINTALDSVSIPKANAQLTIKVNGVATDASTAKNGDTLAVQVTVPFNDVTWLPSSWFLQGTTLRGAAAMRRE